MTIAIPSLTRVPAAERGITIADFLVPIRVGERISPRLRHLALVLAGALFIAVCANLALPGSPVPMTGPIFAVLLVGGALGFGRGALATLVYFAMGLALPVFAQRQSGLDTIAVVRDGQLILGSSGGYLVGLLVAGPLVGRLAELGWDRRLGAAVAAMLIGFGVVYAIGLPWLMAATGITPQAAIQTGLAPFLGGDALELLVSAIAFPVAWWIVGRRPGDR